VNSQDSFEIGGVRIGKNDAPYFIADIAANHDGSLDRAVELIHLAAQSGAHAAKFQHFSAPTLVSDYGFKSLGGQFSHQSKWEKSVYEVYEDASINLEWTETLFKESQKAGISFLSTPYSIELANHIDPFVEAYKIGSGDINYLEIISHVASTGKPWIIATGASDMKDVERAVAATGSNPSGVLMQCNTNYTASNENFKSLNLNVLKLYRERFPDLVLGLSDHTLGHSSVLGAIALGATVFEKHFTDDVNREGPDHGFSMTPSSWRLMVESSIELSQSLGDGVKKVEPNEQDTVVLQRRCLRLTRAGKKGERITSDMLEPLRPAPLGSIPPASVREVVGKLLIQDFEQGAHLTWEALK
jgi:N-acetylneuraminate synthase